MLCLVGNVWWQSRWDWVGGGCGADLDGLELLPGDGVGAAQRSCAQQQLALLLPLQQLLLAGRQVPGGGAAVGSKGASVSALLGGSPCGSD